MGLEIYGDWSKDPKKIKGVAKEYFNNLFARKTANLIELPEDLFVTRLDATDRDMLTKPFEKGDLGLRGLEKPGTGWFWFGFLQRQLGPRQ